MPLPKPAKPVRNATTAAEYQLQDAVSVLETSVEKECEGAAFTWVGR
jgi:hypothetical protein